MRNIESYFDMLPYNGNLVRNSYKSGSTMIGPSEYVKPEPEGENWFYVENAVPKSTNQVVISNNVLYNFSLEYSYDKEEWVEIESIDSGISTITIDFEDKVYLRGTLSDLFTKPNRISIDCKTFFNVGGNILSLIYGSEFTGDEISVPEGVTFEGMFEAKFGTYGYEIHLISAKNLILPIQVLSKGIYQGMFWGCNELTEAPELPATTLAPSCYSHMFIGCTSLTSAPQLPATELVDYCYDSMFSGCTSLITPPQLPATTLSEGCYVKMFQDCTSLTAAPQLPATTLAKGCYDSMFSGCKSLDSVIVYVTGTWNSDYTSNWLLSVSKYGTLYNLGNATDIPEEDPSGCPSGWAIETTPPTPKGTGWTPSDPIDITGTELEDLLAGVGGKKSVSGANQGYFYNVTEASTKFSVGLYVAVTPSTVQSFDINNSMTEEEFKALVNKKSLISKTSYYITDSEKVRVASSSSTYKEIPREEPSPKASYVIEDVTEEFKPEYQWKVTFGVTVDNNEVLSFDTKDSLSEYSKMQYTLTDSNKKLYAENSFNSVPVSVYTMSDLKDGEEYILILQGEYLDGDKDITVYRYFSITKGTPSEDYTVTDDTPSDKRWDNSFDVYVDPNFKEGDMTLLIAANENTTSFEGEVDYSLNSDSEQKEIASSGFSYEELKKGPKPVFSMNILENGTYYLTITDPTKEGYRFYTIIKNVKL